MNDTEESATPRPPRGARSFPAVGDVRWKCAHHCDLTIIVSGDMDSEKGWAAVRQHRLSIRKT